MSERLAKANQKRQERAALIEQNRALLAKCKTENRDPTLEERTEWDRRDAAGNQLKVEFETIEADAARESRQADLDREVLASRGTLAARQDRGRDDGSAEERASKAAVARRNAFLVWMKHGSSELRTEEKQMLGLGAVRKEDLSGLEEQDVDPRLLQGVSSGIRYRMNTQPAFGRDRLTMMGYRGGSGPEHRANEPQSSTIDQWGHYSVPDEPMRALDEALLQFGGIRRANCTILRTDSGADLPIPANDDTTNKGVLVSENTQITGATPLSLTQVRLTAWLYHSGFILASIPFLQDTAIGNPEAYIMRKAGERLGRIFSDHDTKGSNNAQPYGVAWSATLGKSAASATAITFGELVDTIHSVDPAYRQSGQLMFHDLTLAAIKKIIGSVGQPIFLPGIAAREPDTINGYPYIINQSMDSLAAGKHSVLFGDFSHFYIRDVREIIVLRLVERFADYLQVGFLAFARHDARLVDAGTHPIKYLRHPAS